MIVSALLTSVGINSGLCVLLFTLFSLLRRQPGNFKVYLPRLLVERRVDRSHYLGLQRLVPNPDWVRVAWNLSEEELLSNSGLDALVFMRIIIFSLRVFSFAGIIGLFVLLPLNCTGNQLAPFDITVISTETLELFTISNMNNGSKWLWIHCSAVYLVTAFVCFLLYHEYDYIGSKRIAYFYSSRPQPHQFTILVRGIPVPPGYSVTDTVDRFFKEYHPNTYLSHVVIHRTKKIRYLINGAKKLYRSLVHTRPGDTKENSTYGSCFGLFPHRVDRESWLVDGEETMGVGKSDVSEVRSAFVSFRSRYATIVASSLQQSETPTEWVTEQAPEPNDVFWPFFHSSFLQRWTSKVVVIVTYILLTVLFVIPVVVAQGLTNLSQLEIWFPYLKGILAKKVISQIITGYLPNLILQLFLKLVPPIMFFLSSIQGYISHSEIQKSACYKFLWFIIWNVFFANVLSGSFLNQLSFLLDLKSIPSHLAAGVPVQASFFIAYVVTLGWTSTLSELFCVIQFIQSFLEKCCCCCSHNKSTIDEFEVPNIEYHREIPRILFFGLLGITYFFLAPLILPFLLVYFFLAYIVFKNQFINVYAPKYETAGKFWPIIHNSMIFSLVLMHAIALGIFTLKKVPLASTLIFPLPILTLLFNEYCRKRFLPNFIAYSAQNLIRKDREDLSDPKMPEFYHRLVTAYKEPALSPVEINLDGQGALSPYSHDDPTAPLLSHV